MTSCYSRHSGATPTCSARDLNPPIITFVGRLHVSHKGLDTFLEALSLIEETGETNHSAWLVGGSVAEARRLADTVAGYPAVAAMHRSGRLTLWGRISTEALPEIYSRSTVVAMPSRRETFGLVAVQAMLCNTPVAAAAVGGLRDTVVPRVTGAHFAPDDSYALAFILQSLTRNRPLARWLGGRAGRWAEENFGRSSRAGGFGRILESQVGKVASPHPLESPCDFWAGEDEKEVRAALGCEVEIARLAPTLHSAFRVVRQGRPAFAKLFTERPDADGSVYRLSAGLVPALFDARMARTAAAGGSAVGLGVSETHGRVIVHPWCEAANDIPADEALDLADRFAAGGPVPHAASVAACADALRRFAEAQDQQALDAFDVAAARMNAPLTGSTDVFIRCHSGVEILRLSLHAESGSWPLRPLLKKALVNVLGVLRHSPAAVPMQPRIQHGDFTDRHVMRSEGRLLLVDLEEARFGYGDLDRGRFAFETFLAASKRGSDPKPALALLRGDAAGGSASDAALWFAIEAFHRALGKASWGDCAALESAIAVCEKILLPWLRRR
ncbi:MAG: D-inositol-3-phosphate glycosyltransferase [Sphingomonadales bacterium]|jgi:hypothetical protein|nr:D-inositol-3-phosphate glycosyltransferase [Sphingomonadales bacterium]